MRVMLGFGGLIGLLVVAMIIVYMQAETASTVVPAGEQAQREAERIAGRGPGGRPVSESVTLEPNNQADALIVTNIDPNGPIASYFGLRVGDQILQVGALPVKNEVELAKSEMTNAYRQQWPLIVVRNGQRIELPLPTQPNRAAAPGETGGQPPKAVDHRSPLQRQLDMIRNSGEVPTH